MRNATVAGAVGGCQAETGVAAAMAASAATELLGGTPLQCTHAASTVLMNMLGLVCDPSAALSSIHARTETLPELPMLSLLPKWHLPESRSSFPLMR